MNKSVVIYCLILSSPCLAASLREGMCLKNPKDPQVVMQINSVGGVSGLLKTNISGTQLIPYSKAQLEEELNAGVKVEVSCAEFSKSNSNSSNSQNSRPGELDLFGIKLNESFDSFKVNQASNISSCKDERYRTHDVQLNKYSESSIPTKKCRTKDNVEVVFAETKKPGIFTVATIEKDFKDSGITLGVILKKLESKIGRPLTKHTGLSDWYEFSNGTINIYFPSGDYTQNADSKITQFRWRSETSLNELVRRQAEVDAELKRKNSDKQNEQKAKGLDI